MVELKLPKNSRISNGKTWPEPENSNNVRKFRVYLGILMMRKTLQWTLTM